MLRGRRPPSARQPALAPAALALVSSLAVHAAALAVLAHMGADGASAPLPVVVELVVGEAAPAAGRAGSGPAAARAREAEGEGAARQSAIDHEGAQVLRVGRGPVDEHPAPRAEATAEAPPATAPPSARRGAEEAPARGSAAGGTADEDARPGANAARRQAIGAREAPVERAGDGAAHAPVSLTAPPPAASAAETEGAVAAKPEPARAVQARATAPRRAKDPSPPPQAAEPRPPQLARRASAPERRGETASAPAEAAAGGAERPAAAGEGAGGGAEASEPPGFAPGSGDNPLPRYPTAARRRGIEGTVLLEVAVSPLGRAERVEILRSSGSALLDEAALEAVRLWRFTPARRGTEAVPGRVTVPITFRLREAEQAALP